jgi:uncharacterized protein YcbX
MAQVNGSDKPWAEEDWRTFSISGTKFRKLKNCPRCTVPARDQKTGGWANEDDKLLVQKTLRKMFPEKCIDAEWGQEWEGPMFGIHVGSAGVQAELRVGDLIEVTSRAANPRQMLLRVAAGLFFLFVVAYQIWLWRDSLSKSV